MQNTFASMTLTAKSEDRGDFEIHVQIGMPIECDDGDWACSVSISPLYEDLAQMRGVNSVQTACMALALTLDLLNAFNEDGGELMIDDGEFPFDAYAFGVAVRKTN